MFGIGRRGAERGSRQQCLDVEAGTSDDDRTRCAPLDVDNRGTRQPGKPARAEGLARVGHVDQVMGHMPLLGRRGFGRAHVQSAVDQPGVSGDDFDRHVLSHLQRQAGLAAGGGSDDNQQRRSWAFVRCGQQSPSSPDHVRGRLQPLNVPRALEHTRDLRTCPSPGCLTRRIAGPDEELGLMRTRPRGGRRALSSLRAWSWGWGGRWRRNGSGGWRGRVVRRLGRVPGDRGSQAARSLGHWARSLGPWARSLGHRCGQALNPAPRDTMGGAPAFTKVPLSA